jgi:hypothetical protein
VNIRPPTLIMNGSVIDVAVLREQWIMKKDREIAGQRNLN